MHKNVEEISNQLQTKPLNWLAVGFYGNHGIENSSIILSGKQGIWMSENCNNVFMHFPLFHQMRFVKYETFEKPRNLFRKFDKDNCI